jgi:hypothetical protein
MNNLHVWRCPDCGALFAWEEEDEPEYGAENAPCGCNSQELLEHVPRMCQPGHS